MDETFTYNGNPAGSPGNVQSFDGGDGEDTIHIFFDGETAAAPIVTDFTEHADGSFTATYRSTQNGGVNEDQVTITNIENVHIVLRNAYGPNNFPAPSRDIIRTGRGDDFISTAGGNDRIDSGRGVDTVDGGTGGDEFSESDVISKDFSDVDTDISWNIQTGAFAGPGSFTNLEAFGTLLTGGGNDVVVTSTFSNFSGLPGNETVHTGAGDDAVTVAGGVDHVTMGTGDDRLIVDYRSAGGIGTVTSILNQDVDGSYSGEHRSNHNGGTSAGVTFDGVEHFTIFSGGASDTLVTGDGDDIVSGGLGNDRIDVGKGVDQVDGGGGDQFSNGDSVSKDFSDVSADISWDLQANTFSGPGSFTNLEAFGTLVTGSGNDTIVSGTLGNGSGAFGNEIIHTGAGNDTVTVANAVDHVEMGDGDDRLIVDYRNANFPGTITSILNENPDGSYSGEHRGSADSGNRTGVTFEDVEHFTIFGADSSDNLMTGDGDDHVSGGGGLDRIDVGKGVDHVDGDGHGLSVTGDSVSKDFSDVTTDIVWNIQTNSFSGPGSFVNLEAFGTLVTGSGNDTIVTSRLSNGSGLPGNETIFTGAGDDVVSVYFANDIVDMGAGNDRLIVDYAAFQSAGNIVMTLNETSPGTYSGFVDPAGSSTDVTFAGVEHFTILLQGGHDTIVTGNGDDIISTDIGNDTVNAGAGNDHIEGGGGDDTLDGGAGDDYIDGGAHRDSMTGGLGNDIFVVDQANDTVTEHAGEGIDEVRTTLAAYTLGDHLERLTGTSAAGQTLTGNGVSNDIRGAGGDDVLDGGGGTDIMIGSLGDDVYIVDDAGDSVIEAAGEGQDVVRTALASYVLPANVEVLIYTGSDDFTATGGAGDENMTGGSGNDNMSGMGGDDVFMLQHAGDDTAMGGEGNDGFYMGAALTQDDHLDGQDGTLDQLGLQGSYADYTFSESNLLNTEMIVLISGTDTRFGDAGGSLYSYDLTTIDANVGAGQQLYLSFNMLQAGENVVFDGSAETDGHFRTSGGLGNDILTGGAQDDGFYFGAQGRWGAGDKVNGGPGGTMDQLGLHGLYAGATAISFAADQLIGIEMIVLLTGGDTRFGSGGLGYSYDLTMHQDNVLSGQQMVISANTLRADETLTFNGSAETGGSFAIYAGEAADTLVGSAGADILSGRGGADTMTGGAGGDHFLYSDAAHSTAAARDHILDFASGDKIDLSRIDAIAGGGDDAFTFVGNSAFSNTAGELRAVQSGGDWIVEADIDGDGAADLSILVTRSDAADMLVGDFIL